ncbi:hypothetical protein HFD88_000285 [Aspergillus terreus]|nr:hypothetical protein HFD88_000285 [Aspergillus terreus]
MPYKPHEYTHRRTGRKPRRTIDRYNADIPHVKPSIRFVRRFDHGCRQVSVRHRALFLRQTKRMPMRDVQRQAPSDKDCRHPVLLCAEEVFGVPEIFEADQRRIHRTIGGVERESWSSSVADEKSTSFGMTALAPPDSVFRVFKT